MSGCTETGKPRIAILMAVYEPRMDWLREQLLSLTQKHELHYHWVKGHAENPKNNRCDQLAVAEWKKLK